MSKIGVRLKIDVTKIDKGRLFTGQKGVYLDATVFIDPDNKDQYDNNGMITQDVTKEEQSQGTKGNILGNCQVFWKDQNAQQPIQQQGGFQNPPPAPQGRFGQQPPQQQGFNNQAPQQPQTGGFPTDVDDGIPFVQFERGTFA